MHSTIEKKKKTNSMISLKLYSEPVVSKILIENENESNDIYGFQINKHYSSINIHDAYKSKEFIYEGGWLGGYGPHGKGKFCLVDCDTSIIDEIFDRGSYLCTNISKKFVLCDGSVDLEYFINHYKPHNTELELSKCLTSSLSFDGISKCFINILTRKITIAVLVSDKPITNTIVYMKGEMIQTDIKSPTVYAGRFDWKTETQLSGSLNGSSDEFIKASSYVKSIKEEIDISRELWKRFHNEESTKQPKNCIILQSVDDVYELKPLLYKWDYSQLQRIMFECENSKLCKVKQSNKHLVVVKFKYIFSFMKDHCQREKTLEEKYDKVIEVINRHRLKLLVDDFNSKVKSNGKTWYHVHAPTSKSPYLKIYFTPPSLEYITLRKSELIEFSKALNILVLFK